VVAFDAVSYLASALFLLRVRELQPEPVPVRGGARNLRAEISEGVRFVLGDRVLRPLVLKGVLANMANMLIVTLLPTLFVARFGAEGPALLGGFLAVGAVGSFLGARSAPWLGRRLGTTRAIWFVSQVTAPISLLIPLVGPGPALGVAASAWLVTLARVGIDNVLGVSLRQAAAPEAMVGRVNATFRFLLYGALALGSLLAGVIGESVGIRACLWAGAFGLALSWLPIYFSALRPRR
jgi:predicted MFS family arabinose efflux permease